MNARKMLATFGLLMVVIAASGCYHAIVESGRPQSGTMIEDKWADSFLAGLVPPNPIEAMDRCPSGVARVETRLSFLNMVANVVTFSIYSPMHLKVYCAAAGTPDEERSVHVKPDAGQTDLQNALAEAVRLSARTGEAAYLILDRE